VLVASGPPGGPLTDASEPFEAGTKTFAVTVTMERVG